MGPLSSALESESRAPSKPFPRVLAAEPLDQWSPTHSRDREVVSSSPASSLPTRRGYHSELSALAPELIGDDFDLREVLTDREPLAGRPRVSARSSRGAAPDSAGGRAARDREIGQGSAITLPAAAALATPATSMSAEARARRAVVVALWVAVAVVAAVLAWLLLRLLGGNPRESETSRALGDTNAPPAVKSVRRELSPVGALRRAPGDRDAQPVPNGADRGNRSSNGSARSVVVSTPGVWSLTTASGAPAVQVAPPADNEPVDARDAGSESPQSIY